MSSGIWAAASGAVGQIAHLDSASNNLANLETPGFHVDRMVFRRALTGSTPGQQAHPSLEYSVTRSATPDMRAGRITPTGRELDVALPDDNAFFAVQTEQGVRYTKAGNLQVMPDGVLATPEGFPYLGANMRPIAVPLDTASVAIQPTGEMQIDGELDGQRLLVVQFTDPNQLQKESGVMFRAPREAGPPTRLVDPYMETGALEKSTDRAFSHMRDVMDASRSFSLITQVIEQFRAVEESAARDIVGT